MKMMLNNIFQLLTGYSWPQLLVVSLLALLMLWGITIIFRTAGMISSLEQAVSTLIQQFCSILLTGLQLPIKLFQATELYIVMLLEILTGKSTSTQKICVLANSALSIASFYTTYLGWRSILDNQIIPFLLTIGIQVLLLCTSIRIGSEMDWSSHESHRFTVAFFSTVLLFILLTAGYLINQAAAFSYQTMELINSIVHYFSLILLMCIFFSFIYCISRIRMKNSQTGRILFVIYFCTLGVSCFFSYQAFFQVLYPAELRMLDHFTTAKQDTTNILELLDQQVDDTFYLALTDSAILMLTDARLQTEGAVSSEKAHLSAWLGPYNAAYTEYKNASAAIITAQAEIKRLDTQLSADKQGIIGNKGNQIGYNTRMLLKQLEENCNREKAIQSSIISAENTALATNPFSLTPALLTEYETKLTRLNELNNDASLPFKDINNALALLAKTTWTETEANAFLGYAASIQSSFPALSIEAMAASLAEYRQYRGLYLICSRTISNLYLNGNTAAAAEEYTLKRQALFSNAHTILNAVPRISTVFRTDNGEISPHPVDVLTASVTLETVYADTNMERHIFQQNISDFWEAPILGTLSALIAVMVDNLILFVGFMSPKQIEYFNQILSNDPAKRRAILEHLFSKPSKAS